MLLEVSPDLELNDHERTGSPVLQNQVAPVLWFYQNFPTIRSRQIIQAANSFKEVRSKFGVMLESESNHTDSKSFMLFHALLTSRIILIQTPPSSAGIAATFKKSRSHVDLTNCRRFY